MLRCILAGLTLTAIAAAPPQTTVLRPHATLRGEGEFVDCLEFRHDGKQLAACFFGRNPSSPYYRSETIRVWDLAAGRLLSTWKENDTVTSALGFSFDGKLLVMVKSDLAQVHRNLTTGKIERTVPGGKFADPDGRAYIGRDGKQISLCGSQYALVVDAVSGKELFRHKREVYGWRAILSQKLSIIAAPNHQDVDLWDIRTGKLVDSLLDHPGNVHALSFSRDDRLLAVGLDRTEDDGSRTSEVWLWDIVRHRKRWAVRLGELYCREVRLSPSGDLLVISGTIDLDGPSEVRLFETVTGGELARLRLSGVHSTSNPTFRPDGKMLAVGCDNAVRLWTIHRPPSSGTKRDRK